MPTLRILSALLPIVLCSTYLSGCDDDDDGEYQSCDIAAPDCPEDSICRRSGNDGSASCVPTCSPGGGGCSDGYVCHDFGADGGACVEPCDPEAPEACGDGLLCEIYDDGVTLCTEPLTLIGDVFDLMDFSAIEGAHVVAADNTGAAASSVAVTDAEGRWSLAVSAARGADGSPNDVFTLRVSAADYLPYPHGIRPAIPVDADDAVLSDGIWSIESAPTSVGLILLPESARGHGSISGTVTAEDAQGTLVVAEGGAVPAVFGFADTSGVYRIFNVPAGSYSVHGYQAWLQLAPVNVTLADGEHITGVDLEALSSALSTVSGQVNIVNAPGGSVTSVVLVPESTFDDTFARGEVPPGLRAPLPGTEPNIDGAFEIAGVPDGDYVVLAAFENDILVRDPDPSIGGTQIVHLTLPDASQGGIVIISESFKITESLEVVSPGRDGPEPVSGTPTFIWVDDSSETGYALTLYNAFGVLVWDAPDLPRVTGSENVEVTYEGPALESGMFYQWRVTSYRDSGPISMTEDLRGVFWIANNQ